MQYIKEFEEFLVKNERSVHTKEKYVRDVLHFFTYLAGEEASEENVRRYKQYLMEKYSTSSVNSMLASLNAYFKFIGQENLAVKQLKVQKKTYVSDEKELTKEEYIRLIETAIEEDNYRLALILQTVCACGIRISELNYVTVKAVERGETTVTCKNKTRTVFIVPALREKLKKYARGKNIKDGPVFVTCNGKPVNRSNVWRDMKNISVKAGVRPGKVFPHNLRHLFAREFYNQEKDIVKLADILGHTSINTTRIYVITTGSEHRRRMESLGLVL